MATASSVSGLLWGHSWLLATMGMMSNSILRVFQMEICSWTYSRGNWVIAIVRNNKKCDAEHHASEGDFGQACYSSRSRCCTVYAKKGIPKIPTSKATLVLFILRRSERAARCPRVNVLENVQYSGVHNCTVREVLFNRELSTGACLGLKRSKPPI
jgi:hypothetical protein